MNGDDAKQSPQYPLSFSKLPLRPADTYWAPLQCLARGPPHASLTVGPDWPDTSRRCRAVFPSFATAAHLPLRWLLDRAKRGRAGGGGRCLFQPGQESKCGSAASWEKSAGKSHREMMPSHTDTHTQTHSLRLAAGSCYQTYKCAHVRDRLTRSEDALTERK